jgi:hypothetical protein
MILAHHALDNLDILCITDLPDNLPKAISYLLRQYLLAATRKEMGADTVIYR